MSEAGVDSDIVALTLTHPLDRFKKRRIIHAL